MENDKLIPKDKKIFEPELEDQKDNLRINEPEIE